MKESVGLMGVCAMCLSLGNCKKIQKFLCTAFLRFKKVFLFCVGMKQKIFTVNKNQKALLSMRLVVISLSFGTLSCPAVSHISVSEGPLPRSCYSLFYDEPSLSLLRQLLVVLMLTSKY